MLHAVPRFAAHFRRRTQRCLARRFWRAVATRPPSFGAGLGAAAIPCPRCGEQSDSLKSYTMMRFMLFLWVFAFWRRQIVTCCPSCMRKEVALKTLINVIPANLLWFVVVAPWHTVLFWMTFAHGSTENPTTRCRARDGVECTNSVRYQRLAHQRPRMLQRTLLGPSVGLFERMPG